VREEMLDKDNLGGLIVVVVGFGILIAAFLVVVFHYPTAGDVSTALAAITGTIGTIIGAYFGVQAGGAGGQRAAALAENARQAAEVARINAQDVAVRMAAIADPTQAAAVVDKIPIPTGPPGSKA
jgi:hypothetical protein